MKLKDWAEQEGMHYQTALAMFHRGSLPVDAWQTDTGRIIVKDNKVAQLSRHRSDHALSETRRAFLKVAMSALESQSAADTEQVYASIIAQLIVIRKARNTSQAELDRIIGWSEGQTAKYEALTRRPSAEQLCLWLTALKCNVDISPKAA